MNHEAETPMLDIKQEGDGLQMIFVKVFYDSISFNETAIYFRLFSYQSSKATRYHPFYSNL